MGSSGMGRDAYARTAHKNLLQKKTGRSALLNRPSYPPYNLTCQRTELNWTAYIINLQWWFSHSYPFALPEVISHRSKLFQCKGSTDNAYLRKKMVTRAAITEICTFIDNDILGIVTEFCAKPHTSACTDVENNFKSERC